jgi:hypothetical protein
VRHVYIATGQHAGIFVEEALVVMAIRWLRWPTEPGVLAQDSRILMERSGLRRLHAWVFARGARTVSTRCPQILAETCVHEQ